MVRFLHRLAFFDSEVHPMDLTNGNLGTKICLHLNVVTLKVFGHLASLSKISFESSSLGHLQITMKRIPNIQPYINTAIYFKIGEDIVSHTGLINIKYSDLLNLQKSPKNLHFEKDTLRESFENLQKSFRNHRKIIQKNSEKMGKIFK